MLTVIVTKEDHVQCGREKESGQPVIKATKSAYSVAIVLKSLQAMKRIRDHLNHMIVEEEAKIIENELADHSCEEELSRHD